MALPPPDPAYLGKAIASGPGSRTWKAMSNRFGAEFGTTDAVDAIASQFGENLEWFDDSITVSEFLNSPLSRDWVTADPLDVTSGVPRKNTRAWQAWVESTTRTDAAPISDIPTTTSNPERPRTLAAGYDPNRFTMTVVFRDGTYYNYYGVTQKEWAMFRRARSKGGKYGPIKLFLDGKRRGPASDTTMSDDTQQVLIRIARTAQLIYRGGRAIPKTAAQGRPSHDVRKKLEQFRRYSPKGRYYDPDKGRYSVTSTPRRYSGPPTPR